MTQVIVNGLLTRCGRVLMGRRSAAKRHYPSQWSFPGGHVEAGETADAALARELIEEIGVTNCKHLQVASINDPSSPVIYHMHHVTDWTCEPAITNHEHSEIAWLSAEQACALPDLALPEYRGLIRQVLTAPSKPETQETPT